VGDFFANWVKESSPHALGQIRAPMLLQALNMPRWENGNLMLGCKDE